jgi:hypothetical protein
MPDDGDARLHAGCAAAQACTRVDSVIRHDAHRPIVDRDANSSARARISASA